MNINSILNDNLYKVWSKFVFASVVGVVLNAVYVMVDGIFVGQGAGEAGLAGVNLSWPAITVILGIGLMFGTGASSLISIALGTGDKEQAQRIIGTTFKSVLLIGALLTLIGVSSSNFIVTALGATEETYQYTKDYYIIVYLMAIPYLFSNALNPLVRSDGNPNLSMVMVGVGAIGNIILDWLFVIILDMGTAGAALATGAGVILSTSVGIWYFTKGNSYIKFDKKYFCIDKGILRDIIRIGFVSLVIQLSIGAVILLQNKIIYAYGSTIDVAIFSVAGYIISLYTQICVGISQGMQPLIGYHFGAAKVTRMHKLLRMTLVTSVLVGILFLACLFTFGDSFIQLFGIPIESLDLAYKRTLIFCSGAPFIGIIYTMGAYYQALNKNIAANVISIGRGLILQVSFSLLLPPIIGVEGIFYAQSLSDFSSIFILAIVVFICSIHSKKK